MIEVVSTESARSWFCVWNNPQEHCKELAGLEPRELVEKVADMWVEGNPVRSCAINFERADSGTKHLHLVLEASNKVRFSCILKKFPGIHCEVSRGKKADIEDYIYKRGRFEEKNHTVIVPPVFRGNITSNRVGKRVLDEIESMIKSGMSPNEIMNVSIYYRDKEGLIKKEYFAKRNAETPALRDVFVHYHVGETGTGKSYTYVQLCEEYGEDSVYLVSDHSEAGGFDLYYGQEHIVIDELRYMKYSILLQIMDKYKSQIHCRYSNGYMLWQHVHITSILPPEKLYENIVPFDKRYDDGIAQLMRRITEVVYHYKENDEYKTFTLPGSEYRSYEVLKNRAEAARLGKTISEVEQKPHSLDDGFSSVEGQQSIPFENK